MVNRMLVVALVFATAIFLPFNGEARDIGDGSNGDFSFHDGLKTTQPLQQQPTQPPQAQPTQPPQAQPTQPPQAQPIRPPQQQPIQPLITMPDETYNPDDEWLIYWYVCGSNLETEQSQASTDIAEAMAVTLPPNVKILIRAGGADTWHNPTIAAGGDGIYLYGTNSLVKREHSNTKMADPETLKNFLQYGEENFKADHRILIFWDHGGLGGVCADYTDTAPTLSQNDILKAITDVYGNSPAKPPFEIIGFDACLMASYETANTIDGFARYMVASEDAENGYGWYYTDWLNTLASNPATNGAVLGEQICSSSLKQSKDSSDVTFSVIDMKKFPDLRKAHEEYFTEALNRAKTSSRFITDFDATVLGNNNKVEGYKNIFVDLKSLASNTQHLMSAEATRNLLSAIDEAIVGEPQNGSNRTGGGISTYYPYEGYVHTAYSDILSSFADQKEFYNGIVGGSEYLVKVNTKQSQKSRRAGGFDILNLQWHPVEIDDNDAVVKLTSKDLENVSEVSCMVIQGSLSANEETGLEGAGGVLLGSNIAVKADRQNGIFRSDFHGEWTKLNGHLICMERTFSGNNYDLYETPILLNGEFRVLQVSYSHADQKYKVEQAYKKPTANGIASRNIAYLKEGDEITPMFLASMSPDSPDIKEEYVINRFYDQEGNLMSVTQATFGKPFKLGNNVTIEQETISNDEENVAYFYVFVFRAPDKSAACSSVVVFDVLGDIIGLVDTDGNAIDTETGKILGHVDLDKIVPRTRK